MDIIDIIRVDFMEEQFYMIALDCPGVQKWHLSGYVDTTTATTTINQKGCTAGLPQFQYQTHFHIN